MNKTQFGLSLSLLYTSLDHVTQPIEVEMLQAAWEELKEDAPINNSSLEHVETLLELKTQNRLQTIQLNNKMKNLVTSLLTLLLPCFIFAQVGLIGGATATSFYGKSYYSQVQPFNPKIGGVGGVYDRIKLSDRFIIQPEIIYINKGALIVYDEPGRGVGNQFRLNFNYFQTNILVGPKWGNFAFLVGGYGAYLLNSNHKKWNYPIIESFNKNYFRVMDGGAIGALSYDCHGMIFELKYSQGFVIIGHPGHPLNRWGVEGKEGHTHATAQLEAHIPFKIK